MTLLSIQSAVADNFSQSLLELSAKRSRARISGLASPHKTETSARNQQTSGGPGRKASRLAHTVRPVRFS